MVLEMLAWFIGLALKVLGDYYGIYIDQHMHKCAVMYTTYHDSLVVMVLNSGLRGCRVELAVTATF